MKELLRRIWKGGLEIVTLDLENPAKLAVSSGTVIDDNIAFRRPQSATPTGDSSSSCRYGGSLEYGGGQREWQFATKHYRRHSVVSATTHSCGSGATKRIGIAADTAAPAEEDGLLTIGARGHLAPTRWFHPLPNGAGRRPSHSRPCFSPRRLGQVVA
jgi:hypothetical protein